MADGVTLDPGAGGDKIATDDLGATGHVQWVKLRDGTDGGTETIGGDTANGLDVDVTRVGGNVTVVDGGGSISVDDNAGSLTVDNATISVVGGGAEATAQRVTIASDSTGVLSVDDNGSTLSVDDGGGNISIDDGGNSITVDGSVSADTELTTADLDSGAGTDTRAVVGLVIAKSGGAANVSNSDPIPISDAGGTVSVDDGAGSLTVDNATISVVGSGTEATAQRVTIATDSTGVLSVDDNGSTISVDDGAGSLTVDNATISVVGSGTEATAQRVTIATDSTGVLSVDDNGGNLSIDDGGNSITVDNPQLSVVGSGTEAAALRVTVATDSTGVLSVDDNGGSLTVDGATSVAPRTSGGLSIGRDLSFDETETEIKATAGQVYGWYFFNAAATTRYVKFFNATAANVTVGSTTPVMTVPIPAGSAANVEYTNGIAFGTAICVACTTGVGDADATAPTANDLVGNVLYT